VALEAGEEHRPKKAGTAPENFQELPIFNPILGRKNLFSVEPAKLNA
jgi:hypothetical protein